MGINQSELSKIYQDSQKTKINLQGKKFEQLRQTAIQDPEKFWSDQANNLLWNKKWNKTLDWNYPFAKWFIGGQLNASVNCLDRHIVTDKKNKAAIIYQDEIGNKQTLTYNQLYKYVNKFAAALRDLGIKKGDRITIYLPMIPELMVSMLACSRLGAIHIVVFSGFSIQALSDRVNDSESRLIITCDYAIRRGKKIMLKNIVDDAIPKMSTVENVISIQRGNQQIIKKEKDLFWHDLIKKSKNYCEPEIIESTDSIYILYTSGTTGKPKGILHSIGGYLTHVYATSKWVYDFKYDDIFFITADIGWVTGHSYVVYGPLLHGATQILYEGAPDFPEPDNYWRIIQDNGVTIFHTTPTALRMYMSHGEEIPNSFDLSSLRLLGTVGEPINPEVWMWYFKTIGKERCPIIDTWWQTETGGIMLSACLGIEQIVLKPGSATLPIPGVEISIFDESGKPVNQGTKGYLAVNKPWPGMLATVWKDTDKYVNTYWTKFPGYYYTGDFAMMDNDNYLWLLGRADDVIKVAGHRIGTMELESAFVSFNAIAEAAVTTRPHEKKGDAIVAFLVLRDDYQKSPETNNDIIQHIRTNVGAFSTPEEIYFVKKLPKTRSGKIMRRLLKSIVTEMSSIGDTSTIEDDSAIDEVKRAYRESRNSI